LRSEAAHGCDQAAGLQVAPAEGEKLADVYYSLERAQRRHDIEANGSDAPALASARTMLDRSAL
jgi:hypothetical protein